MVGVAPVGPALGAYTPCWLAGEGLVWWCMQGNLEKDVQKKCQVFLEYG